MKYEGSLPRCRWNTCRESQDVGRKAGNTQEKEKKTTKKKNTQNKNRKNKTFDVKTFIHQPVRYSIFRSLFFTENVCEVDFTWKSDVMQLSPARTWLSWVKSICCPARGRMVAFIFVHPIILWNCVVFGWLHMPPFVASGHRQCQRRNIVPFKNPNVPDVKSTTLSSSWVKPTCCGTEGLFDAGRLVKIV